MNQISRLAAQINKADANSAVRVTPGHVYSHDDLKWDSLKLRLKSGRLLAAIEPDGNWPGMSRVRGPNGLLTDILNITRVKDAAISLACADLNKQRHDIRPVAAPPMRLNPKACRHGN